MEKYSSEASAGALGVQGTQGSEIVSQWHLLVNVKLLLRMLCCLRTPQIHSSFRASKDIVTQKYKLSHYLLAPMLMEREVMFTIHKTFLGLDSKTVLQHPATQLKQIRGKKKNLFQVNYIQVTGRPMIPNVCEQMLFTTLFI